MKLFKILNSLKFIFYSGMWGAKVNQSRNLIEGVARSMIFAGQDDVRSRDQAALAEILWPSAKFDIVGI